MSRLRIQQRTRIYLGCEGQSEQSYAARLGQIADAEGLRIHIDNDVLQPGGGDPLALVQLAVRRVRERAARRGAFAHCALLPDKDRLGQDPDWVVKIPSIARKSNIHLIWQDPCHEGFLLRHLAEQTQTRPPSADLAGQALRKIWPNYRKGLPASDLAAMIDRNAIERVAYVEEDFRVFLQKIGFLKTV
jgi:hypothetical protein